MAANTRFLFNEYANGIQDVKTGIFYPYITDSFSAGVFLPTKKNVRYYIRSLVLSGSTLVTDAGTACLVTGVLNHELLILAQILKTTLVVNQFGQQFDVRVLLDREEVVTFTATSITTASVSVTYAEVNDLE
jgi:uncharacterized membrane protein